jgi:hypothetical protein
LNADDNLLTEEADKGDELKKLEEKEKEEAVRLEKERLEKE